MPPSGIEATPTVVSQPSSMGLAYAVQNYIFAINLPSETNTGHGRQLSNLAKMYTKEAKYSSCNKSFTFKLAIFQDICSKADVPLEIKVKTLSTIYRGLTFDYYYSNISAGGVGPIFDHV